MPAGRASTGYCRALQAGQGNGRRTGQTQAGAGPGETGQEAQTNVIRQQINITPRSDVSAIPKLVPDITPLHGSLIATQVHWLLPGGRSV